MVRPGTARGISVIIPSMCDASRANTMRRAIASVRSQEHERIEIIVVLNGDRYDRALVTELECAPDVRVVRCITASLPGAIEQGRNAVEREFFCYLDDDDEYLPGAFSKRLQQSLVDGTVDFVVTNGYRYRDRDVPSLRDVHAIKSSPLNALIEQNWLASCGFLMRTDAVPAELFCGLPKYLEWTAMAFRLMLAGKRMVFVDEPTYRYYFTPGSLWNRPEALTAGIEFVESLLADSRLPAGARPALRRKLAVNLHSMAAYCHHRGQARMAWHYHLRSMQFLAGLRFITYTRKLFRRGRIPIQTG